jgi:hypothetical protein
MHFLDGKGSAGQWTWVAARGRGGGGETMRGDAGIRNEGGENRSPTSWKPPSTAQITWGAGRLYEGIQN